MKNLETTFEETECTTSDF